MTETKQIPLNKGAYAIVDASDFDRLMKYKWRISDKGYAMRTEVDKGKSSGILMHRMLLDPPKGMMADHINGNPLDNRRCNLRIASALQNAQNRGKNKNSVSIYKGVCWKAQNNKWQARIRIEGRQHHIGLYDTELEAAQAYNQAARIQHGQYARLNNIPEPELVCSEICVPFQDICKLLSHMTVSDNLSDAKANAQIVYDKMSELRPYLRTTEPHEIPVDVETTFKKWLDDRSAKEAWHDDEMYVNSDLFDCWNSAIASVSKPVMVSLEKCTKACMEADYEAFKNTNYARKYDQRNLGERYEQVAKAVLDAAGVKYE